jgi:iron(III) transport system ATP-binding protein
MSLSDLQQSAGIEIDNLHLSFGETKVLRGINLSIPPGEFFAFLGPSGSGKSTLLRAIAGFGPQIEGSIRIGERDVSNLPPWKRDVGMVFQSYALWPHMSVAKNVAFGLEERKVNRSEVKQRVGEALELVGLSELADRRPNALSGGQQQRVALARTIVIRPKVLLLDEPLSNLDANLRVKMRRDILSLQQTLGITTIFVTHDQEEANTTSSRMAVLDKGVLQQVGSPMELYDAPQNRFVAEFLGNANIIEGNLVKQGDQAVFNADNGLKWPLAKDTAAVQDGKLLIFRPHNTHICTDDTPDCLQGVIEYQEFLGSNRRFGVNLKGQHVLIDTVHQAGDEHYQVGDAVRFRMDTQNVVIL